ncbi:prepilin peptidase [Hephaestia sp. GCM10023244]|uniref:A24 family peptidase n=1 Tax=unclassified Hephaestia TaxID=2631281 RepID=UPI0020772693|nr:prepilin peptidase [Hephaestia sp. MAHUQ-44]MCM8729437.1 prepilin peptidase [Hephaestia sp. MAHUQ-44]
MIWGNLSLALLGSLALLLVSAGIEDVRTREIANWKNAAIALIAPLWWISSGLAPWPDMAIQFGLAAAVFAVFVLIFAAGWMGGGDVKLIGALALWFPLQQLVWLLVVMSLAGGVITLALAIEHRWRRATTPLEIPYGVAIAVAALLALREPLFNQLHA